MSRIVRLMYHFSDVMGTRNLVEHAQRSLMMHAPDEIREFRGLERFMLNFMREEFEEWVGKFGLVPTPSQAVSYMVARADQTLNERYQHECGEEFGILHSDCQILDPATGGGHYYIAILRGIYNRSVARGDSIDIARQVVKNAIGHSGRAGRVHAVDIQPMCVTLTHVNLARFCHEIGLNTHGLEPRIYLGDTLRPMRIEEMGLATDYTDTMFGRKHLVVGNPPWGSYRLSHAVTQNKSNCEALLRDFKSAYDELHFQLTGNEAKSGNQEVAYVFFARFSMGPVHHIGEEGYIPPVVSFLMPNVGVWSAQWVGMRQWILQHGRLTLDNLGGSTFPINRDDGENIFSHYGVGVGNSVFTHYPSGDPYAESTESMEKNVSSTNEDGETVIAPATTRERKLGLLNEWSEG